eukprot:Gb_10004 [translate_table: standard]
MIQRLFSTICRLSSTFPRPSLNHSLATLSFLKRGFNIGMLRFNAGFHTSTYRQSSTRRQRQQPIFITIPHRPLHLLVPCCYSLHPNRVRVSNLRKAQINTVCPFPILKTRNLQNLGLAGLAKPALLVQGLRISQGYSLIIFQGCLLEGGEFLVRILIIVSITIIVIKKTQVCKNQFLR